MLYGCWRQIAQARGNEVALRDLSLGQHWTFTQLARHTEDGLAPRDPIVYPQGHSAEFIFAVLRAWRRGAIVCPLEPEQKPPTVPLPAAPCCHLKTTSATSGLPRTIAFTAEQLAADAANIVATMGLRPEWPNLGVISLAHSYGFSNLVLPLLLHGIPLILVPSPLPETVRRAAASEANLTLAAVPALWRAWHEAGAIPRQVRLAVSAGAPLPLALELAVFDTARLKIHNFYGSSECGGIAYDAADELRPDDACVGTRMQNVELSLDKYGCLDVRSQAVGETYWPDAEATLGAGRFQTSDLAQFQNERVYLRGRLSDQINVAGRKVSPAAIEQVLAEHRAVRECLVFGVPSRDANRADLIVACVAAKGHGNGEELKQFLLQKLPEWQVPRKWWFVDALSANPRGKLSRAAWREKFLATQG
jgi:long-chain acyl-CoA synthetase